MPRVLFRILAVLLLAGAALTVRTDAINVGDLNVYFSSARAAQDRVPLVPPPIEGIPEPATLLVFGVGLSVAAARLRRGGA
jgi:hypothetical protein